MLHVTEPFSVPIAATPTFLEDPAGAYLNARGDIFGAPDVDFTHQTLSDMFAHVAFQIHGALPNPNGPPDELPADTVVIAAVYDEVGDSMHADVLDALDSQGITDRLELPGYRLVGLAGRSNLVDFSEPRTYAEVAFCTSDDPVMLYANVFATLVPASLPAACGAHIAYATETELLIFQVWASKGPYLDYREQVLWPALSYYSSDVHFVAATCLGLSMDDVIYPSR
jgi:hypothetical protein